jgi:hypothetical protein
LGAGELGVKVFRVVCASFARFIAFSLLSVASIHGVSAQPTPSSSAQNSPVVSGVIRMPLISPEKADQFFANRIVPQSSVPGQTSAPFAAGESQQILGVAPILGHELPTDAEKPNGFDRADFAVRKPMNDKNQTIVNRPLNFSGSPAGTAVREQPPEVAKP